MIYACWSLKGGSGTTSLTTAMALAWAKEAGEEVLLVDLAGDIPAVLGAASSTAVGIGDWLSAGKNPESDSLKQLEYEVTDGVSLLPCGREPLVQPFLSSGAFNDVTENNMTGLTDLAELTGTSEEAEIVAAMGEIGFQASVYSAGVYSAGLIKYLSQDKRKVIVDCGNLWDSGLGSHKQSETQNPDLLFRRTVVGASDISWVFTRSCYLGLKRISSFVLRPSGVVLLMESGRALNALDVSEIIGAPIVVNIAADPSVMRAIDTGLLSARLPRRLERMLGSQASVQFPLQLPPQSQTQSRIQASQIQSSSVQPTPTQAVAQHPSVQPPPAQAIVQAPNLPQPPPIDDYAVGNTVTGSYDTGSTVTGSYDADNTATDNTATDNTATDNTATDNTATDNTATDGYTTDPKPDYELENEATDRRDHR